MVCKLIIKDSRLWILACIACISVWYCEDSSDTLVGVPSVVVVGADMVELCFPGGVRLTVTCSMVNGIFGQATSAHVFGKE